MGLLGGGISWADLQLKVTWKRACSCSPTNTAPGPLNQEGLFLSPVYKRGGSWGSRDRTCQSPSLRSRLVRSPGGAPLFLSIPHKAR